MCDSLNVLMIDHHRRFKSRDRSHALAKHLVKIGHKVTQIVTSNNRRMRIIESEWEGVRTIETPDLLFGRLRSGWDIWCLLNRLFFLSRDQASYDLIHCFETRPATIYPALFYRKRHNLPLISDWNDWWGRGGLIDEVRPKLYRLLFGAIETYYEEVFRSRGSGLTVISTALADRAIRLGVPPDRILHLPGGAFPKLFQARSKEACRNHVGLPLSDPILGFSSLDSHFDLEIVMQSVAIVAAKYPSVKLMVTGKAGKSVSRLAQRHNIQQNLFLTGFLPIEELPWYLGCADLFVLPFPEKIHNVGRWPNKIGDYMSLGRPTVSNPVGDIRTLFENNDVGFLPDWDPEDFAKKIIYLLDHPDIAHQLGENARKVAKTQYDWAIIVRSLEGFYYEVLRLEGK